VGRDVVDCGVELSKRWLDIVEMPIEEAPAEDNRTCEEITSEIWVRAGFKRGNT
jgi:hypothetical protein